MKELIIETNRAFPNAQIIVVQQQDPKCSFKSHNQVADRALIGSESKVVQKKGYLNILDYCKILGKVYLAQDQAFKDLSGTEVQKKLRVLKMYVDAPVPDNGFYDSIHTNKYGASILGKYLLNKIYWNL